MPEEVKREEKPKELPAVTKPGVKKPLVLKGLGIKRTEKLLKRQLDLAKHHLHAVRWMLAYRRLFERGEEAKLKEIVKGAKEGKLEVNVRGVKKLVENVPAVHATTERHIVRNAALIRPEVARALVANAILEHEKLFKLHSSYAQAYRRGLEEQLKRKAERRAKWKTFFAKVFR